MIDVDRERQEGNAEDLPLLRSEILDSWRRSKLHGVNPDHSEPIEGHTDADWRIARIGVPILESMAEALVGADTSLLLSAPDGTLLWRWDENSALRQRLNRSGAVIGTTWSEDIVGTNGLGTSLETAKPILIKGSEHFAASLKPFTCAGAPIRHPITGRVTGVLSVTSLVEHASGLMAPTVLQLAREIEQELYTESGTHEREMLRQFLGERRRMSTAVVAVSAECFIANSSAAGMGIEHTALWRQIEASSGELLGHEFPDGSVVTSWRPVLRRGDIIGAVVVLDEDGPKATGAKSATCAAPTPSPGRSWDDTLLEVRRALEHQNRLVLAGESGVGKRTLLRSALAGDIVELDCALVVLQGTKAWLTSARDLLADSRGPAVVLSHLEALDEPTAQALASVLDEAEPAQLIAATCVTSPARPPTPQMVLDRFGSDVIEIPPLRRRPQDTRARLSSDNLGITRLTRAAMDLAQRHPWPGNDRQLDAFRDWVRSHERANLDADDLPLRWRLAAAREGLSTIQVAELEAIAGALREHGGNKAAAAKSLGISRSSMYRKMREYRLT